MKYTINGNNITLANGYSLDFEHPIKETFETKEIIVITLDVPAKVVYKQNVFVITTSGDYLWRVGKVNLYASDDDECSYVGSTLNQEDELVLFNWCDTAVIVDPYTGEVLRTYQTK